MITPDSKNFNAYSPLTCEFLNRIGLRPDELRDKLEKTFEKFSGKLECELFESIIKLSGAKKCIEVGVFTGASSISIARGLPEDGKLVALDVSEDFTSLARKYWALAGLENKIELHLGPANEYLQKFF